MVVRTSGGTIYPINPADAPSTVYNTANPMTKLSVWKKIVHRLTSGDSDTTPPKLAKYIGTNGKTHGVIKDAIPAQKATGKEGSDKTNDLHFPVLSKKYITPMYFTIIAYYFMLNDNDN